MKRISLSIAISFFILSAAAQNLVPNGDFEQLAGCPLAYGQLTQKAVYWKSATGGTPDYFNACANANNGPGVPSNNYGYQNAHSGVAYAGIHSYLGILNTSEYMQVALTDTLIKNECYTLKM